MHKIDLRRFNKLERFTWILLSDCLNFLLETKKTNHLAIIIGKARVPQAGGVVCLSLLKTWGKTPSAHPVTRVIASGEASPTFGHANEIFSVFIDRIKESMSTETNNDNDLNLHTLSI